MRFFVGLDWASDAHAVCLIDERGTVRWQTSVPHSATGLDTLARRLRRWRQRGALAIALERPSGLLVDTLVHAGFDVVPIHPNVVKATRPRYSAAGGKSDPGQCKRSQQGRAVPGGVFPTHDPANEKRHRGQGAEKTRARIP